MDSASNPLDTSPKASELQFEILRKMPVWKKAQLWGELCDSARHLAQMGIRRRNPDADEEEVKMRLFSIYSSREEMVKWYSWDPDEH